MKPDELRIDGPVALSIPFAATHPGRKPKSSLIGVSLQIRVLCIGITYIVMLLFAVNAMLSLVCVPALKYETRDQIPLPAGAALG